MIQYIARRLVQLLFMLFLLSIVLFVLVNLAPGGPLAGQGQSRHIPPERAAALKRQFGLDKPLPVQYVVWLVGNDWMRVDADGDGIAESNGTRLGILRGDFGFSFQTRQPVLNEIKIRLPNTLLLMAITLLVALVIAIPAGILSAVKQYSKFDITVTTLSFAGQAIPEFWLGLLLILIFYVWLQNPFTGEPLLPSGGMSSMNSFSIIDRTRHLILPVICGALGWIAWYSRFLRSSMLDVLHLDYLRTARAKGLPEKLVLYKHALRNALIPLVTMLALDLPTIFAGAVFIEILFSWPGMGRLYYTAATQRDYPILLAVLIIGAGLILLSNLFADIL
ncbi:MAG: binding-protein-dependent transport system inner rane protein, partial [Acidobacteria bacterium]|nr:binding-protein-dependent transport system inner rane protein [Acidobacteriota bacterium]